jgi:sulfatase modifying factor 1
MKLALLILASTIIFLSFSKKEKEDPFFYKNIEKGMCLIPQGKFLEDTFKIRWGCNRRLNLIEIDSFYLSNHEVTNLEYREFVNVIAKDSGELYKKFLPDTLIWRDELAYNEEYVDWYFRHPAYNNYPVVGVTHEQAEAYCQWLTKKYMSSEKRKYKNVVFKLPTKHQWTYAAFGGGDRSAFPFKNGMLMSYKKGYQANFRIIPQENLKAENGNTIVDNGYSYTAYYRWWSSKATHSPLYYVTAPSISFPKNEYNLYNLAGNVEEYVAEKGITKGGGWKDTGYFLQNFVCQTYDSTNVTSDDRGFRVAMEIVK